MLYRQTIFALTLFTLLLVGCQRKDAPLPQTVMSAPAANSAASTAPAK